MYMYIVAHMEKNDIHVYSLDTYKAMYMFIKGDAWHK